jgi:hypothetical protein|tara:strand:+ start:32383 stop:32616 length:234 start_codon:yes stop_codon:yes gene_type:complete
MVKNLVSSLSVAALSADAVSLPSELGDEHAVRPNAALNIADKSNGDFKELSIEFILEVIGFIRLTISVFIHKYVTDE